MPSSSENELSSNPSSVADGPDPATANGKALIVAMDLLRDAMVKTQAAVIENVKTYHRPEKKSEYTRQAESTFAGIGLTLEEVRARQQAKKKAAEPTEPAKPTPSESPTPTSPPPPSQQAPGAVDPQTGFPIPVPVAPHAPAEPVNTAQHKIDPASGLPLGAPGRIDKATGLPTGIPEAKPVDGPVTARVVKTNELLSLILAELKTKKGPGQAVAQTIGTAPLTYQSAKRKADEQTEQENRTAYQRRVKAGQRLGDYEATTDYAKRMRDPKAGFFENVAYNRAGAGKPGGAAAAVTEIPIIGRLLGALATPLGALVAVVGALLIGFKALLNQQISGFSKFQQTIDLLTSVFAPILLPVFVLLAASVLAVSGYLHTKLLPLFKQWFEFMAGFVFLFELLTGYVFGLINAFVLLYNTLGDMVQEIGKFVGKVIEWGKIAKPEWKDIINGIEEFKNKLFARVRAEQGAEDGKAGAFRDAIGKVLNSLERDIGPKASLGALDTDWNKKLVDALNIDPIEAEKKKNMMEIIQLLRGVLEIEQNRNGNRNAPVRGIDGGANPGFNGVDPWRLFGGAPPVQ